MLERVDANWWRGLNIRTGTEGIFPAKFARELTVRATRCFEAEKSRDLRLAERDTVLVLDFANEGWWRGRNERTGQVGSETVKCRSDPAAPRRSRGAKRDLESVDAFGLRNTQGKGSKVKYTTTMRNLPYTHKPRDTGA